VLADSEPTSLEDRSIAGSPYPVSIQLRHRGPIVSPVFTVALMRPQKPPVSALKVKFGYRCQVIATPLGIGRVGGEIRIGVELCRSHASRQ
jgi:hypothetical protein